MDIVHFERVKDKHNVEYSKALSLIDMATGYPVVIPLPFNPNDMDIKSAFFTHWLSIFGAPNCMIADNEETFKLLFDTLKNEFGTIIQASSAYHYRSHGQIERVHRTLQERIISVCASQGLTWVEGLPTVLASIRFTVNSNGGVSPYELVFGSPAPLAMHRIDKPNTGRWSTKLLHSTRENLIRKLTQVMRTTTKRLPKPQFKTGDWVKLPLFHKTGPKNGNFSGPYCVLGHDLRGNVFLSNGMIRHMSQIVKTPVPRHSAEQVLSMLDAMYDTGKSYYMDIEGQIRAIPEDRVDLLQHSMPTIVPTKGKGHGLTVFDNPMIDKLLRKKPGQVRFTLPAAPQARAIKPTIGSPPPCSPVFSSQEFSCDSPSPPHSPSSPQTVSRPSQEPGNYSGGTDSTSRLRPRNRTRGSTTHRYRTRDDPEGLTSSSRSLRYQTRKKQRRQ